MQTYDCHVRLANTTSSEVPKIGATAPEIIVLRELHGLDSVVRTKISARVHRSHADERARLQKLYGDLHPGLLNRLFGHNHMPLPDALDPEGEARAAEAVAKAEAEAAEKANAEKEKFDYAVKQEVKRLEGERRAKEANDRVNQETPPPVKKSDTLHLKA